MSRHDAEPPCPHGAPARAGVLLVNLGTPDAPTPAAVRAYLREFLSDPRVVELPRTFWLPFLHLFVLNVRPRASARRYARVWTKEGSPLRVHTERQASMLRGYLGERTKLPLVVDYAMRYGTPGIAERLRGLKAQHCDRILLVPLYPQYSASTTATAVDEAFAALARMRNQPALRTVRSFHDHAGYIGALAQNVRDYWTRNGRPEVLVMSFHGLPRRTLDAGDPYHCECQKTARLLAAALALKPEAYRVAFQSRFGRARWLTPYTARVLAELGARKCARVDVVCPGFVSDCLETLEEIAIEGKAIFCGAGGGEFHHVPCLNERNDWLHALTTLVMEHLQGWRPGPPADELERTRERALAMGAPGQMPAPRE
ncbi:MAG: ferrochelatase [Burkholderiales bacterium]|nr:ferrochelatase [Burkholderiales bacterium]